MNIIKIVEETYLDICPEEFDITYLGTELNIVKALEAVENIYENRGEKVPEWSEMVRKWLKTEEKVNELVKEIKEWYLPWVSEEYLNELETLEDFLNEDSDYFISEIIDNRERAFEFFEANGIKFGTVGYSPWSYYIAPKDTCISHIQDLWEGWNFYNVRLLNENGNELVERAWEVYIPDTKTLREVVYDYFGIKDFYLVDNQEATYMKHKKVKEFEKVERFYKII